MGRAGARRVEVNAVGRIMRELDRQEGQIGSSLQITVDTALQSYARPASESKAFGGGDGLCHRRSAGDRLIPRIRSNKFVRGISFDDYAVLRDNERRPLASKCIQDAYPPGSTFKMITVCRIEAGVISPTIRSHA